MLVAAGGDGTVHEVVNGLLFREDKKKIPLAFIPNGSGDDCCNSLGIMSVDHALDYICKGEIIKCDTARILLDHESESTLPEGLERLNFCRYMVINSGCAMPPLISFKAKYWKTCCGKASYSIAALIEAMKGNLVSDIFEVFVDGQKVKINEQENVASTLLMVYNGKTSGGGMIFQPYACMNDGMLDLIWIQDPAINNLMGVGAYMDKCKKGGIQAYDHQSKYLRGK